VPRNRPRPTPPPGRSTSSSGRWSTCPTEEQSEATPIYEAVASVWFREAAAEVDAADWESPGDREWRAAAERANQQPEDVTFTAGGLPRRRAGARLVPPGCPTVRSGAGQARPVVPVVVPTRAPRPLPTAFPTGCASAWPPTSAGCAKAGTAPSRSTRAIRPPGSGVLFVVP
jgi:hypothetical protein